MILDLNITLSTGSTVKNITKNRREGRTRLMERSKKDKLSQSTMTWVVLSIYKKRIILGPLEVGLRPFEVGDLFPGLPSFFKFRG